MSVRRRAMVAGCALAAACAGGCLSATPRKTPNQRAVERAAPHVEAPPPPDAGRHPVAVASPSGAP